MRVVSRQGDWTLILVKPGVFEIYEGDTQQGIVLTPDYEPPATDEFLFEPVPVREVDSRDELLEQFDAHTPDVAEQAPAELETNAEAAPGTVRDREPYQDTVTRQDRDTESEPTRDPQTRDDHDTQTEPPAMAEHSSPATGTTRPPSAANVDATAVDGGTTSRTRPGSGLDLPQPGPPPIEFAIGLLVTGVVLAFAFRTAPTSPLFVLGLGSTAVAVGCVGWVGYRHRIGRWSGQRETRHGNPDG